MTYRTYMTPRRPLGYAGQAYKTYILYLFIFFYVFILPIAFPVRAERLSALQAGVDYVPGEVIVKYKQNLDPQTVQRNVEIRRQRSESIMGILQNRQEDIINRLRNEPSAENKLETLQAIKNTTAITDEKLLNQQRDLYLLASTKQKDTAIIIQQYEQSGLVEYAEPNYLYQLFSVPNDTDYSKLWGMKNIKAEDAWNISTGSAAIKVAVVDTGVDSSHPDLAANIVETRGFASRCRDGKDLVGHGTHVAGTIGAVGNNSAGVAGVNWNLSIFGYCVNGSQGIPTVAVTQAIDTAVSHGAKAINLSLGGSDTSQTLKDSIASAVRAGTVVVAAAGNTPGPYADRLYPASDPNVITVSAVGSRNELAVYSSYGKSVDVTAPGGNAPGGSGNCRSNGSDCIYSTWPNGQYRVIEGTSMATPHVTGLVGLIFSVNPNLTPQQVQQILQNTAQDLGDPGRDDKFGYGLINAQAALAAAGNTSGLPTAIPTQSLSQSPTGTTTPIILPSHPCQDKAQGGDYDCDGKADQADYETWQREFSQKTGNILWFEFIRRNLSKT